MITYRLDGRIIRIRIETGLTTDISTFFDCGSGNELYAELLYNQLLHHKEKTVTDFAKDNYNKGWSDKASHKTPKQQWFPGNINYRNKK